MAKHINAVTQRVIKQCRGHFQYCQALKSGVIVYIFIYRCPKKVHKCLKFQVQYPNSSKWSQLSQTGFRRVLFPGTPCTVYLSSGRRRGGGISKLPRKWSNPSDKIELLSKTLLWIFQMTHIFQTPPPKRH